MVACLVAGYLAVWCLFGWIALGFDAAVHRTVDTMTWLSTHPWLLGGGDPRPRRRLPVFRPQGPLPHPVP
jgi:hypothetical protein